MTGSDSLEIFVYSFAGFWVGMIVGYALALHSSTKKVKRVEVEDDD